MKIVSNIMHCMLRIVYYPYVSCKPCLILSLLRKDMTHVMHYTISCSLVLNHKLVNNTTICLPFSWNFAHRILGLIISSLGLYKKLCDVDIIVVVLYFPIISVETNKLCKKVYRDHIFLWWNYWLYVDAFFGQLGVFSIQANSPLRG